MADLTSFILACFLAIIDANIVIVYVFIIWITFAVLRHQKHFDILFQPFNSCCYSLFRYFETHPKNNLSICTQKERHATLFVYYNQNVIYDVTRALTLLLHSSSIALCLPLMLDVIVLLAYSAAFYI